MVAKGTFVLKIAVWSQRCGFVAEHVPRMCADSILAFRVGLDPAM